MTDGRHGRGVRMTNKRKLLHFVNTAVFLYGGCLYAAELSGETDSTSTCAVSGRLFEAISAPEGFEIEMTGVVSPIKKKTRLVNGSFEFQAVPAGPYQFRIFDRTGHVILKRTTELTGTGDMLHFRRDLPLGSEGLVSLHQLEHKSNNRAMKLFQAGLKARDADDLRNAADNFEKAVALDPLFTEARLNLTSLYLQSGQNDKALDHARLAYKTDPDLFETGYDLAATLTFLGNYQEANAVILSLPRTDTFKAEFDTVLALSLYGEKHTADADEYLNRAAAEYPTVRLLAANVLTMTGQLAQAMDQVREYVRTFASKCERRQLEAWLGRAAARQARIAAVAPTRTVGP